ncbi:MAG: ATP-binding protein [Clostridia bacterium]|nr:ATP-binding protein [Clostridia bacterium]
MILSVRVNNYKVYSHEVEMTLFPYDNINSLDGNVRCEGNFKALKSACLYGGNNSGKTCLVSAINCLKGIILNAGIRIEQNFFHDENKVTHLGVSFLMNGRAFSYDIKYDLSLISANRSRGLIYECLKELTSIEDGEERGDTIFIRDVENNKYKFVDDIIPEEQMKGLYSGNILIYAVDEKAVEKINPYTKILTEFASTLDVIDSNYVPVTKTINELKNNTPLKSKIIELIKTADLDIDNFDYVENKNNKIIIKNEDALSDSDKERLRFFQENIWRLHSFHREKEFPSVVIDSVGTSKIISLAGYIADALENGKTLVVDEFDSGLHFMITRAMILLFNNVANVSGGQLIVCTHDFTLLDCENLFRQDQIWFVCKDKNTEYLYSLADLDYADDEVLSMADLIEKYRTGELGIIPEPNLISIMSHKGAD